ncbi:MAG: 2-C-methyl-D-erythritol 4-phosphate cytidylyltransferase [Gemmatimonadota bacterium]|nr:2-C-methyl-D-erythritol 4-phosphate cytidylyltransferase [Gemmatimonadota bacterium]
MSAVVVVAGGSGERLAGDVPKQLRDLGGLPILAWSVAAFQGHPEVHSLVVVLPAALAERPPEWLSTVTVVTGGASRAESVLRGVAAVPDGFDVILVHDGVRPFVSSALISRVIESAAKAPTVPTVPVTDTIKTVGSDGFVVSTPERVGLRAAQTPQGFPAEVLRGLHESAEPDADITDDGVVCERAGIPVRTVEGDPRNLKITGPEDLEYARWLVETGVIRPPRMS